MRPGSEPPCSTGCCQASTRPAFEETAEDWTDLAGESELAPEDKRCVTAAGTQVLLVRTGGELYALSDRCSHRGGPLH
jgi:phenylpropionate dioxygenase-like ring-hydroxylating dioxygenase large terminal subunit